MQQNPIKTDPLVTVLLPTYNRPRSLSTAIDSVLAQSYSQFELIVIRDGGQPIASIMQSYDDARIVLIDRDENRGKAASLNEALARAKGQYVCYLDDDDQWYSNHIQTLVHALEDNPEYGLAYSDLYKVHYRALSGSRRHILAKNVEISRDFDRMLMLQFNHVLHVSLMHRKDLLDQAGPYNEDLRVLIDWDLTRRLCFYTDFLHIPTVTGEYHAAVADSDRISVQQRKDTASYLRTLLTIRGTRPPQPWPCMPDMSVIILHDHCDKILEKSLADLWSHGYYPCQFYIPLPSSELDKLETAVPNIVKVPVSQTAANDQKIDAALASSHGDFVALVPAGLPVAADEASFLERSLYPLMRSEEAAAAYEIVEADASRWGAVFHRKDILDLRRRFPDRSLREAAAAAGKTIQKPDIEDYPFQFDNFLTAAGQLQRQGQWHDAAGVYQMMAERYGNRVWMQTLCANALFQAGNIPDAETMIEPLNQMHPTVARLMIQARICRKTERWSDAVKLYQQAKAILDRQPSKVKSNKRPLRTKLCPNSE
ncbi:MAG: glycosyltransferase family 2 protein [Planctomycetota bacterium]|jgi:glycosyltransferase involved in cell wall biosynthesis